MPVAPKIQLSIEYFVNLIRIHKLFSKVANRLKDPNYICQTKGAPGINGFTMQVNSI